MKAQLLGIAYKECRRGPMIEVESALISPHQGLHGDHRGKPGKRQLTLMTLVDWQSACSELNVDLPWTERRANLVVDELPLYETTGQQIMIGDVLLEITGETDPCERMEEAQAGLFAALQPQWRGGVTCRVLRGGKIQLDDTVELIASDTTSV